MISFRLLLNGLLAMMVLMLVLLAVLTKLNADKADKILFKSEQYGELADLSRSILILTSDFEYTDTIRIEQQWQQLVDRYQGIIRALSSVSGDQRYLLRIGSTLNYCDRLMKQIITSDGGNQSQRNNLITISLRLSSEASRARQHYLSLAAEQRQKSILSILVQLLFVLAVSVIYLLVLRHWVFRPVNSLLDGFRAITEKGLENPFRIVGGVREIQQIALAAETMRANLLLTTASKAELKFEIDVRKKAENEAKNLLDELSTTQTKIIHMEKLSTLGSLVGGIVHEINNPLMGISNYISYAQKYSVDDKVESALKKAQVQIERLGRITKSLLMFARDSKVNEHAKCDVHSVISRVVGFSNLSGQASNVTVDQVLAPTDCCAKVDEDSLEQILLNLLINARDALQDTAEPVISISTEVNNGKVRVLIADNGPGIAEEVQYQVFDPFFTTKPMGKGTGMGLSVCVKLLEAVNGSIYYRKSVMGGAEFVIELIEARRE